MTEMIVYTHDGEEVMLDELTLTATDGKHSDTKKVMINIGLVDDETPRVNINRGLQIRKGEFLSCFNVLSSSICRSSV